MKNLLITLILILTCQLLTCQIKTDYEFLTYDFNPEQFEVKKRGIPESIKVIGVIAGSVILEAIGDAKYDNEQKQIGKLYQAASIGLLVASPFLLDIDRKKWGWYFATYLSFRVALFDPFYNVTGGESIGYIGTTSYWDKGLQKFSPSEGELIWGRSMFLIVAISIPINKF